MVKTPSFQLPDNSPTQSGIACFVRVCLLALLLPNALQAEPSAASCSLSVLSELGWQLDTTDSTPGTRHENTCASDRRPVFEINPSETPAALLQRSTDALDSITTRCLVNRRYQAPIRRAINKLTANKGFTFLEGGQDPRDPFEAPAPQWQASLNHGYDIPANRISTAIDTLYTEPFRAECSTAVQIAQLAVLREYYGRFTDHILHPKDIGIGIWREYAKSPSIAANDPLLMDKRRMKRPLKSLAQLGKNAFYGQTGYLRSRRGEDFIDSTDNRGQNFLIVSISDNAVRSLLDLKKPLSIINRTAGRVWKKYYRRLIAGEDKQALVAEMLIELESTALFFSEIKVYVHPLGVRTFAELLARQFNYNPRTSYRLTVYADYQSGYINSRFIDYRLKQCTGESYCRRIDRRHYELTDASGQRQPLAYDNSAACNDALSAMK